MRGLIKIVVISTLILTTSFFLDIYVFSKEISKKNYQVIDKYVDRSGEEGDSFYLVIDTEFGEIEDEFSYETFRKVRIGESYEISVKRGFIFQQYTFYFVE